MIINVREKNDLQFVRSSRKDQFMKTPQMDPFFNLKQQNSRIDRNPSLNDFTSSQANKYGLLSGGNDDQNIRSESRNGLKKTQSEIKLPKIEHEIGNRYSF